MYRYLVVLFGSISFFSCVNMPKKNDQLFEKINQTILNSNRLLESSNLFIYRTLEEDAENPLRMSVATKYQARALIVKGKADRVCQYIDSVNKMINPNDYRFSREESKQLFVRLNTYIYELLNFNEDVHNIFKNDTIVDFLKTGFLKESEIKFYEIYFENSRGKLTKMALNKFYNDARRAENRIIAYCVTNYCKLNVHFDK